MSADAATAVALLAAGVSTLHEAGGRRGLCRMVRLLVGASFAGPAVTVAIPAGDNLGIHAALEHTPAGSVVCVASLGAGRFGVLGELIATAARTRGVAALVIDDGIRDLDALSAPPAIAARGVSAQGTVKARFLSLGEAVALGGVLIKPGDWVVGDHDGVCVVPPDRVETLLVSAAARIEREDVIRAGLEAGDTTVEQLGLGELIERGRVHA